MLQKIQRDMVAAGYDQTLEQIVNKLKKVKTDYRDQKTPKKTMERSGSGWPRKNPHFDVLDSVLGDRPVNRSTRALNSATPPAILLSVVDETVLQNETDPGTYNILQRHRHADNSQTKLSFDSGMFSVHLRHRHAKHTQANVPHDVCFLVNDFACMPVTLPVTCEQ